MLIDPELAELARALLPEVALDVLTPEPPRALAAPAADAVAAPRGEKRDRTPRRRARLLLAAVLAVCVTASFATITKAGGAGPPRRSVEDAIAAKIAREPRYAVSAARHVRVAPTTSRRKASTRPTPVTRATPRAPAEGSSGKAHRATTPGVPRQRLTGATQRATTTSLRPAPLLAPPLLRWQGSPSTPYFDLVLWRDGQRLLDSWPTVPRLRVPSSWSNGAHRYRLEPGTYAWFVYPGIGSRSQARYGPLLTSGQFTIAASAR